MSINLGAHGMCIRECTAKKRASGFTLIELIVVVAIVGILAAVAYPSYLSYLVRNNRAVAQSSLMDIAQRQQQYLLDNRAYAPDVTSLNVTVPTNVTQNYTVAIAILAGPPPTFTVTATPIAGTKQAADGAISIDQAGTKIPSNKW
jgi:type IV pilus assembly protein PilE